MPVRASFTWAAGVTVGAIFAALFAVAIAAPASAKPVLKPQAPPSDALDRPHPVLLAKATVTSYRVRSGDTLSRIAGRKWGNPGWWPRLWYANRSHVRNPDIIRVGQLLRLPYGKAPKHSTVVQALAAIPKPPPPPKVHTAAVVRGYDGDGDHDGDRSDAPAATHHKRHHHYARAVAQASYSGAPGSFQACVIRAESGGNPRAVNPSSGAGGLYQFLPSTWASLGYAAQYPGGAQTAPVSVQNAAFQKLYAEAGTSPWAPYDGC
jgi:Transglycosylase-like domain/LysM domain